jgi:selenide,water dikinase
MRTLNRHAADQLHALADHHRAAIGAVTDVTGFGLAGHAWEIAERSELSLTLAAGRLPLYPGALTAAEAGTRTGGDACNGAYLTDHFGSDASEAPHAGIFDASGRDGRELG